MNLSAVCVALSLVIGCAVCAPINTNSTDTGMSTEQMQSIRQQFEKEQAEVRRKQDEEAFRQQLRQESQIQQENLHDAAPIGAGSKLVPGVPIIPTVPVVQTVGGTGSAVPIVPVKVDITTTTATPMIQGRADDTDAVLRAFTDLLTPKIGGNMIPKGPPAQPAAATALQTAQPQVQPVATAPMATAGMDPRLMQFPMAGINGGGMNYPMGGLQAALPQTVSIPMAAIPLARSDQQQLPQTQQANPAYGQQQLMARDMNGYPTMVDQQTLNSLYGNQAALQQPVYTGTGM
ncbi:uncharacterized protein LOC129584792 [Paramacrobiotus metropolitanus]|uniref:uncharacterized protein LOC129584792 n=1 Tax=Paramacrobiotus metropolitanus TaxID=2943436 RepID=UPI002445B20B|nr:uncharacterized protein LOC129584792 [Paramacrobiotus metropolitanus]